MRSPLAYPLTRSVDGDAGGAADLQTDVMRFMAILALCLVAIFALVQSLPLAPEPAPAQAAIPEPVPPQPAIPEPVEVTVTPPAQAVAPPPAESVPSDAAIVLTRSRWSPKVTPAEQPVAAPAAEADAPPPPPTGERGFTLAFESDLALTRLVAAGRIGFYAIAPGGARRMTVSDSRVSFWEASTPNSFHEMEAATVPPPVIGALTGSGGKVADVKWGVTLPADMRRDLDVLLRQHAGGDITIHADGRISLEAKQ